MTLRKGKFLSNVCSIFRRMSTKWKITIAVLLALLCLAAAVQFFEFGRAHPRENPTTTDRETSIVAQNEKETTIRNVTNETVHYTIKPFSSEGEPMKKALKVGAIDRFPGDSAMDIVFQKGEKKSLYRLDPGMPYSFRYNENDELELYDGSHGRADALDLAPYVPTPMVVVEKMLELAKVDKNDVVFDLGCGDGRIVILAARKYGARGVGIDLAPQRIKESNTGAKMAGVEKLVEFRLQDVMKADLSKATVVTMYLLVESNELLRPKLEKQLKPGTYIVSHNYYIPGWDMKEVDFVSLKTEDGEEHDIYVYQR